MYGDITIAYGDGIGPEIMKSVVKILKKVDKKLEFKEIKIGEHMYNRSYSSGISEHDLDAIKSSEAFLKAPITTPQGGGYKSLNVTIRKLFGLYANIRPAISYHPFIKTLYPNLDVIVIRENEEDLYSGIEYRSSHDLREAIKITTITGCKKIIRYAFEYAVKNKRKKVTCLTKDNIMKFSEGIFHKIFDEIAQNYPDIIAEHYIVDIGTAKIVSDPARFDVIVTSNLFGDIISDVTAEMSGSVGLSGSANIGDDFAMFEAIHGSAPRLAGQNIANPSGLLNAAIMMLRHIGKIKSAALIANAWRKTIEDGIHTADIYNEAYSTKKVTTTDFTQAIIDRLGQNPDKLATVKFSDGNKSQQLLEPIKYVIDTQETKVLVGFDLYMNIQIDSISRLVDKINSLLGKNSDIFINNISTKGLKIWPNSSVKKIVSDHYCFRFLSKTPKQVERSNITSLLSKLDESEMDYTKVICLYRFGNEIGYSLLQAE
ncbi:NADP-dependent isocitrate dehydrogenase [Rickettsia endosymbiont of Cardiosporidium cionae]|uniref:NADP-dependent isocitrate dehydrogenase n=1 Tax=Rickettsia endosymbiont of Cardiosporidium cionae TaxID=2777155 RepID=UPI001895598F|nr:NADP-dependent isocitrate dehydrogenase [Rickettsia endosymbiont of Cardiosporidium cionae]KAF8818868.1 isocitrate dehydrogenase [Rickettsia endosymbiont of Cardiosporidium cionae]